MAATSKNLKALEKVIEGSLETVAMLEKLQKVPLPRSINEALGGEWLLELAVLGEYGLDLQNEAVRLTKTDRQRVIPMKKAMEILEAFEQRLLDTHVVGIATIVGGRLSAAKKVGEILWAFRAQIWDVLWDLLWRYAKASATLDYSFFLRIRYEFSATLFACAGALASVWYAASNVTGVARDVLAIFKLAASYRREGLHACLKQSKGCRYQRRKVAR